MPAREAKIGIVDRMYARVGASDNIARGQSTFMVEMQETAHILHGATSKSLVVLDEIGRGTATFDGLSIAWAVAEHLAKNPRARPKTLFATHYHELTDLADAIPGVVNAHVAAREWKDEIVFLHKILAGRSDRSYGIQVARLAGLPPSVIARARDILTALEHDELSRGGRPALSGAPTVPQATARPVPRRAGARRGAARSHPRDRSQSHDPARGAAAPVGPEAGHRVKLIGCLRLGGPGAAGATVVGPGFSPAASQIFSPSPPSTRSRSSTRASSPPPLSRRQPRTV